MSIKKSLDYEKTTEFSLQIRATDKGTPSLYTDTGVEIGVINVNEYPPTFTKDQYEESVSEAELVGYLVITVSATDADADSTITYSIPAGLPFIITGNQITISSLLDYEEKAIYEFDVTATDDGSKQTTAKIIIHVLDFNDNSPIFVGLNIEKYVPENEKLGTTIATVIANDKDSNTNGMVVYSIIDGNIGDAFYVDPVREYPCLIIFLEGYGL